MRRFSFLQMSDVHLDSILNRGKLTLSESQRADRSRELLETVLQALAMAKTNAVDAVLIPGGLWDTETISAETALRFIEACAMIDPIPIFIAPGDSDYLSFDSLYRSKVLHARGFRSWSKNVHIFDTDEFKTIKLPTRPDVAITGRAFVSTAKVEHRLLENPIPKDQEATLNILLYHGALESYRGADAANPEKYNARVSDEELAAQEFDYTALGHFHDFHEVRTAENRLVGAYSGCLVGRTFEELGPRCALLGTIEPDAEIGKPSIMIEPIELQPRRMMMVAVDISGLHKEDMLEEILVHVQDYGIRADADMVLLVLEGRYRAGVNAEEVTELLREQFYNLTILDNGRPDYLSEHYDERTTEWKFIESMLEMKKSAEQKKSSQSPGDSLTGMLSATLSGRTIEDALYYGLDALKVKKVMVRHVD